MAHSEQYCLCTSSNTAFPKLRGDSMNFRTPPQAHKKNSMRYAVAQGRVSGEDQKRRGVSLPAQKANIEKWAAENNVIILKDAYYDHSAYRGLDEEKEFLELIEFAKSDRRVSLFLVDEKSRFARARYIRITYEEELRRAGVKVYAVSEPNYDTKTVHGVWMDGISITKNEAMSVEIAYHTRKGMRENVAQRDPETGYCYKNGGPAAYGYSNKRVVRGKDKRGKDLIKLLWEVDEEKKETVRHVVLDLWMRQNWTWRMIRDWLNDQGIPSPRGGLWGNSSIRELCIRALEGEYTGRAFWNRTSKDLRGTGQKWKDPDEWIVVEDAHPVIISPEELEELMRIKGPEIQKRKGKGALNPKNSNSQWLLSGVNALGDPFFCCMNGEDHYLVGHEVHGYRWYLCNRYKNYGPKGCDKPVYINKDFEITVVKAISKRFTRKKIKEMVDQVNSSLDAELKDIQEAGHHVEKELEKKDREINELMSAIKEAGVKSKVLLISEMEAVAEQKELLERQLAELEKERPRINFLDEGKIYNKVKDIDRVMKSGTNKEKRDMLRTFVHSIELDPDTGEAFINYFADPFRTIKIKTGNPSGSPVSILNGGDTRI